MFTTVCQRLVKTLGADVYLPSLSIGASENLAPLSLVERKASRWWLGNNSYYSSNFTLQNVIEGTDAIKVETEPDKNLLTFNRTGNFQVNGSLEGHFKTVFEAELSGVDSVTLTYNLGDLDLSEVNEQSLLDQLAARKINMQHELVSELAAKSRRALCVVTGVVHTTTPTTVTAKLNLKVDGDQKVDIPETGAEAKEGMLKQRTRTLNLPAKTVLAYRVAELSISDSGSFRVMVSHNATGGFHATVPDSVDSVAAPSSAVAAVASDAVKKGFEGLPKLERSKREDLAKRLLGLCIDAELLLQLATLLNQPASTSKEVKVQGVLDCLQGHREDEVTSSVQLLCRSLRNLDTETLTVLSAVEPQSLPMLVAVLERTYTGDSLSFAEGKTLKFVRDGGPALVFLLTGPDFSIVDEFFKPPTGCQKLLNSVYSALCGLNICYGGGDNFSFE